MLQIVQKGEFLDFRKRYQIRIFLVLLLLLLWFAVGPSFPLFGNVWLTLVWPACEAHCHFKWRGCCVYTWCTRIVCAKCARALNLQHAWYAMNSNEICTKVYLVQYTNIHIFPFLDLFSFSFSSFVFLLFFPFLFRSSFLLQQNELKWKRKKKKIGNRPVNTMLAQINKKSYIFARVLAFLLLSIAWQNKEKILGGVGMPGIWNWKYVCKWRSLKENTFQHSLLKYVRSISLALSMYVGSLVLSSGKSSHQWPMWAIEKYACWQPNRPRNVHTRRKEK